MYTTCEAVPVNCIFTPLSGLDVASVMMPVIDSVPTAAVTFPVGSSGACPLLHAAIASRSGSEKQERIRRDLN